MDFKNPTHNRIMRYFDYSHLPSFLQPTSKAFHDLAEKVLKDCEIRVRDNEPVDVVEVTVALRKLLEAKDAAVRAILA